MIVLRSIDTSLTWRSNTSLICRQFYDQQIFILPADWILFDLQIILQLVNGVIIWSADNSSICKWFFDLKKFLQSAHSFSVCRSNIYSIQRLQFYLQIVLWSTFKPTDWRLLSSADNQSIWWYLLDLQMEPGPNLDLLCVRQLDTAAL